MGNGGADFSSRKGRRAENRNRKAEDMEAKSTPHPDLLLGRGGEGMLRPLPKFLAGCEHV